MFKNISTLKNFEGFDTKNIKNMSYMFYNCFSLEKLPYIAKFNTSNVTDMNHMFYNCSSLKELPDISNWDIKNVTNTSHMFYDCELLTSLPDISNWKTDNIRYMNYMFANCKSLSNLPSLSKWNINIDTEINGIWDGCFLLKVRIIKKSYNGFLIGRCFNNIIIYLNICWEKLSKYNCEFCSLFICLIMIISLLSPIVPIYSSFKLDNASKSINNPIKYFNITNISNIINLCQKNENDFLNYVLNFTAINEDIKFESEEKNFKFYSITTGSIVLLNILFFLYLCLNDKERTKSKKMSIFLIFLLLINIFSIYIVISNYSVMERLKDSISVFYNIIKVMFKIKIPKANLHEIEVIDWSINASSYIFWILIILTFFNIYSFTCLFEPTIKFNIKKNNNVNKGKIEIVKEI